MRPVEKRREAAVRLDALQGDWRVERLGGLLPPMVGVWKRIRGGGGETCVGPLPAWPFRLEGRGDHVALIYRRPFSAFVDELRPGPKGSWLGVATLRGRRIGRFRMLRLEARNGNATGTR